MKINNMPDKIWSGASYCTSGGLICGGGFMQWVHALNWSNIAVIVGVVMAIATYLTSAYYQNRQTKAYEKALDRGFITPPSKKD